MAKAAIYLVEYAPSNTIWLCEQNKVLYEVELQQLNEFSIKFEPKVPIYIYYTICYNITFYLPNS